MASHKATLQKPGQEPVHYLVEVKDLNAHLFQITLRVARPAALQKLQLPVWIPGSYLVREFSKNLQELTAQQERGKLAIRPLVVRQLDKNTWQLECDPTKPLQVQYSVYAHDNSVRTAWLDAERGFFNGTSLFLRVEGQTDQPHTLQLPAVKGLKNWQLATGLAPLKTDSKGFGIYRASDYDELVDCPVEMGAFWSGNFRARGVAHRFVVAGAAPGFDGTRLLADAQKICETQIDFWHAARGGQAKSKPPHAHYVFMLNAVDDGYGGLEHRNSTALICNRKDLPRSVSPAHGIKNKPGEFKKSEGYTTLLGLISHEYFHTWNVKRLRPAEFASYDYNTENYTGLLWFFEGFTSYYDDLLLCRAGLIDAATYLKLLNKTLNQVLQTPGRQVQSVAQASFDAWVKYYRQDENTANHTVSYYTKGAAVALCLDLTLRAAGQATLDELMRGLWQRSAVKRNGKLEGGPVSEEDVLAVVTQLGGHQLAAQLAGWVHSTTELPLKVLLEQAGLVVHEDPAQLAQGLGLRVLESAGKLGVVEIKTVLRGSLAQAAGFAAGDEWWAVQVGVGKNPITPKSPAMWRIRKLDDLALYTGQNGETFFAVVSRDQKVLHLPLVLPHGHTTWRLDGRQLDASPTSAAKLPWRTAKTV